MRPIRAIVYGLGMMGRLSAKFLRERDVEVVAGYVRTTAGKDFSAPELAGTEICLPDVPFEKFGADVALITHQTTLKELYEPAMRAAKAGLDVVTIAEDAFDPFYVDEDLHLAHELDAAFRSHGRTLVSVGVQDTFWFAQPLAFSAAMNRIDRITGRNIADWSAFGERAVGNHPVNLTAEEFTQKVTGEPHGGRGIFTTGLRPLLRALRLEIEDVSTSLEPIMAESEMTFPRFNLTIAKGKTRGFMERTRIKLKGGMIADGEFIMTFLPEGQKSFNEWVFEGSPTMNMRTDNFAGDVVTAASLVNRVRDAMDARPGFLGCDQLGIARHWQKLRHPG